MTTSNPKKFLLLLWKNWVIQKRHPIQTVVEIALPVLFCSLLILIRVLVDPGTMQPETHYTPLNLNELPIRSRNVTPSIDFTLVYTPPNPILESIVRDAATHLNMAVISRNNRSALNIDVSTFNMLAGVVFNESMRGISTLPKQLFYTLVFPSELRSVDITTTFDAFNLNWMTNSLLPDFSFPPRNRFDSDGGLPPAYHGDGFLAIQNAMSRAFINAHGGTEDTFKEVFLQRYPYPAFKSDPFLTGIEFFIPLIILVSFFYSAINIVKYITLEKERQLKEVMKIMGLPNWLHWSAWFAKCFTFLFISVTLITIMLKVNFNPSEGTVVFAHADWSVVWVFLMMYSVVTIMFCFMWSVFFSKANTAAIIAGIMWFIFYTPYSIFSQNWASMDFFTKFFVCLFSNTGMSFGFMLIVRHESTGIGVQWSNLFSPVTVDDNFSVGNVLIAFVVASVLYLCIALYFEKVFPGEYGVPEPWYFLFSKRFWSNKVEDKSVIEAMSTTNKNSMEPDPEGKTAGIRIKGLTKSFAKNKYAVKNLHLNMFEDQITVLLGHNGAGKTTTMSMMTGIYKPTAGTAYIDGHDIRTNMDEARNSLGLCTQHNVLFDDLTVREHLTFFSKLKGYTSKQADADVRKYTELLDLLPKENKLSKTLSGGMKRKLAIGISLCGGSKIVLCDEPTSGMDPSARRFLWDLLEKEKKGRTILLTTHFMDEADVLGDRIAIMADGDLKCVGSSFFLKKKYGIGYRLVCVKDSGCDTSQVTSLLQKFIPDIRKETDIGSELSYILNEDYSSIFKDMLRELEDRSQEIRVSSYGVSLTTLEEVFLKVGSDSHAFDEDEYVMPTTNGTTEMNGTGYQNGGSTDQLVVSKEYTLLTGSKLRMYQIEAMIRKKFLNAIRSYVISLIQLFIPIVFLVMTILTVRLFIGTPPLGLLEIKLNSYSDLVTILQTDNQANEGLRRISAEYERIFSVQPPELRTLDITQQRIDRHFLNLAEKDGMLALLNTRYMIGASITAANITAWFNNEGMHTPPLATNMVYNAQLRSVCADCELRVAIDPLPFTTESEFLFLQAGNNLGFQLAFNTGFAMSFVAALFVLFYVRERVSRSKLLQFVSGTNIAIFWTVSFVWDFLVFTLGAVLFVVVLAAFQEEGWSTFQEVGRFFLLLWFFGFSVLPLTYLGSFLTDVPSSGMTRLSMFYVFTGIIAFMAVFIIGSDLFDLKPLANTLRWIFMIFPHYAMSEGISNLNLVSSTIRFCNRQCDLNLFCTPELMCSLLPDCCVSDFLSWENPGIGRHLTFMVGTGVVCLTILFVKEYRLFEKVFNTGKRSIFSIPRPPPPEELNMDDDVQREKERIAKMEYREIQSKNLVLKEMTKYYGSFLAVNKISLSVEHEECFGLLGVNGAGKTSTFKMLTGDESISSGEAWVKGINIKTNMPEAHKEIGYCPQFDALLDDMTGRETLYIFSLLRGIPRVKINSTILQLATSLNFVKHLDKRTKQYSGGNKRKLSTALALLGNPSVIYLDEPTTGMDPGAKRHLWNIICKVRDSGISIVLTSHSMEECEALCTKLAIMVNGEFKCLGSTQHLKNKFSKGYILNIKMKQLDDATPATRMTNANEVKDYVTRSFQGAVLKEEHADLICYHITSNEYKWSKIFEIMEDGKKALQIEDYALGQTSLEQVFLFFTKYQRYVDN